MGYLIRFLGDLRWVARFGSFWKKRGKSNYLFSIGRVFQKYVCGSFMIKMRIGLGTLGYFGSIWHKPKHFDIGNILMSSGKPSNHGGIHLGLFSFFFFFFFVISHVSYKKYSYKIQIHRDLSTPKQSKPPVHRLHVDAARPSWSRRPHKGSR